MISIILPVLNECRHGLLEELLAALQQQSGDYELIVVDSNSSDETPSLCEPVCDQFVQAGPGNRAYRLNTGAKRAKGKTFLFHHPRSILPPMALESIQDALKDPQVAGGGFTHRFDQRSLLLNYTSWYNNTVQPKKGVMYLDHCLFVRREVFEEIGGFPNWDIFEDTWFPKQVAQRGKLVLLPETVTTSATRYRSRGILRQTLTNQMLKLGYSLGIHPQRLNHLYEGKNPFNVPLEPEVLAGAADSVE